MERKIFYEDARRSILNIFSNEFPLLNISDIDRYIGMFYNFVNYEEEGAKIRPSILVTSNINFIVKNIPLAKKIVFYEDSNSQNLKGRLKTLMCFCKRGWNIYINYGDAFVEYGIVKTLSSIKDKTFVQLVTEMPSAELSAKASLIVINVLGGGVCKITSGKGISYSICFNLNSQNEYNWEIEIGEFVEACVSKIKTTNTKLQFIKNLLLNIFRRVMIGLHGAICLVVEKDFVDTSGFLQDGTWLKEPIEFAKLFLRNGAVDENILRSYADIITSMLDSDGITVIDNAGRIRAFNVFVETSISAQKNVVGGARRRAAYTLLQSRNKKIVGVYFQSQDGDNFYKASNEKKQKSKIKIVDGQIVNQKDEMLPLEIIAKLQASQKEEIPQDSKSESKQE